MTLYISYEIGQHFKENGTEGSTSHILAHTVLGAAVAAAGGNDALTAGLAAGGAEAVAPILSSYLYGGKNPSELTADEKSTISSIVGLAGSALGATTGDVGSTIQSGNVAQNAVENNDFSVVSQGVDKKLAANKKKKELEDKIAAECKNKSCIIPIAEKELGDKAVEFINNMTIRQLAAALGADYDPLTGERITPNERLEAKASMLGLGFTKTVSGVAKLTDDALIVVEKKLAEALCGTWSQYPKVMFDTPNGQQEFANIGGRFYSQHAVARMQPSYQRYSSGVAEGTLYNTIGKPIPGITSYDGREMIRGRSISPNYVEDIIKNASPIKQQNGNWSYKSGDLNVILSPDNKHIITIVTEKE